MVLFEQCHSFFTKKTEFFSQKLFTNKTLYVIIAKLLSEFSGERQNNLAHLQPIAREQVNKKAQIIGSKKGDFHHVKRSETEFNRNLQKPRK